jgi:arginase
LLTHQNLDFDEQNLKKLTANSKTPINENATFKGNAKNNLLVGQGTQILADLVEEKLLEGRFPLILGGDHSIGIGSLAGVLRARPNTGVIWVDAHADLNTPGISESGNMHGMPVGLLMEGVAPTETIPGFEWLKDGPRLQPDSIVYVGLRDVDPEERELIQSLGIAAYTMHEIDRYGIGQVMEMALGHLLAKDPNRPLHLSYDIDAVDPILAPATGTTVRGGLNFREAHYVAEAVAVSGNLASADIVELNPTLSHEEGAAETVDLGLQIITSFMGKSII